MKKLLLPVGFKMVKKYIYQAFKGDDLIGPKTISRKDAWRFLLEHIQMTSWYLDYKHCKTKKSAKKNGFRMSRMPA